MSIVVVGSCNMDYMMQVTSLPKRGETIFAVSHSTAAGGKGANQAVAAARLGSRVYMVGRVGSDEAGRVLVESLERAG
ncbi:MAG TPA: ribokinase, partial [Firmicutes bacterium]|nr:ribokinase [Bacillota bacterium]